MSAAVYPSPIRFEDHRKPLHTEDPRGTYSAGKPDDPKPSPPKTETAKAASKPFMKTSPEVIKNGSLSPWARLLHTLLLDYNTIERGCFPGRDRLADDLGTSTKTIDRSLIELCDAGIISKKRRGRGHTNEYFFPDEWTPVSTHDEDDSSPVTIHPDEQTPVSTPEWTRASSPEWTPVSTKLDVVNTDPVEQEKYIPRANEIVRWFAKRVGGVVSKPGSKPWDAAHDLAEAGATDADLEGAFTWLQGEAWVKSISLVLIASKFNDWKSKYAPRPAAPDPSNALQARLSLLRRGMTNPSVFSGMDYVKYVTGSGAAENLAEDIARLEDMAARP